MIQLAFAGFLTGLLALSVPLILHLLRRKPVEVAPFPSLMLLGASIARLQNRNNIRKWIILLLRCLALALLALAFAWPYIPNFSKQPDSATVLLWDDSFSTKSRSCAAELSNALFDVISRAGEKNPVLAGSVSNTVKWSGNFTGDSVALAQWLKANMDGEGSSSFERAIREADIRLQAIPVKKRKIVIVSDRQALPWKSVRLNTQLSPGTELEMICPETPLPGNVAVTSAKPVTRFTAPGNKIGLDASITNFGAKDANGELIVKLGDFITEKKQVTIKAGQKEDFKFTLVPRLLKPIECSVEFEVYDDIALDNRRFFALNPSDPPLVLMTALPPRQEDFIRDAFEPSPERSAARVNYCDIRNFKGELAQASLIVLREGTSMNSPFGKEFEKYLQDGGAAVLVWRDSAEMRGMLLRFGVKAAISGKKGKQRFGEIDFEHPVFKKFMQAKVGGLFNISFFNPPTLVPPEEARVLASFGDGRPALLEISCGKGKVFVCATSMERSGSDWPVNHSFLPFWRELLTYCSKAGNDELLELEAGNKPSKLSEPQKKNLTGGKPRAFVPRKCGVFPVSLDGKEILASVNPPEDESNPARLQKNFPLQNLVNKDKEPQKAVAGLSFFSGEQGRSFWRILLALALFCALCELALANRTAL
ncbi:MAG TPA: hypothetical protein DCZ94_16810 [Lentisphaeria bacterium]|nr:MAG: hypothetical protein A2X48_16720 [Lentisphaerae bacterium GWF2_49_21]HBC88610.1 hypothetical protein [Lentisphaeria bacterium]